MKKILFLPALFFTVFINAQETQTEDEVYIGKGKTFGNYKSIDTKPVKGQVTMRGTVVSACKRDCCNNKRTTCSFDVQGHSGDSLVTVDAKNFAPPVPKTIVGRQIIVEGADPVVFPPFAATGLKGIN